MKEKLIENLRNEASRKARLDRKSNQLTVALKSLLVLYIVFGIVAVVFLPQSTESLSIVFRVSVFSVCLAIVIVLGGAIFLPFGKTSKERIDEKFKELVSIRIESKSEHVSKIKSELLELEQELKILNEI